MLRLLINIPRKQAFFYAIFLVLYEFLTYIANDMIMPGMMTVVASFHGSETAVATSLMAYVLGGASLQLFLGPLSDAYGRRPVMIFGAGLFFLFTMLIACSTTMDQFLIARFFQGMGLCFICVIGYATLQDIFSEMDAIRLIAIMANVSISAPLLGPLLGAIFIYYFSWRVIFVVIGLLALVALWGLWRFMPEPVSAKTRGPFLPRMIVSNYKQLLLNPTFVLGSLALGMISVPCMAWIGLSPIMLVNGAHVTVIEYGLWQLPVFGAYILGNMYLHRLTHHRTVKEMIVIGSSIAVVSLFIVFFLPMFMNQHFFWIMPGLIAYFFGAGIISAPWSRFILFSTDVSKGTASALMSMIFMSIQAVGIEVANALYTTHNNRLFSLYCVWSAVVYCFCFVGALYPYQQRKPPVQVTH
jgi:DHA1 family multidrug/chloramphenicol efflux transport protein-like MFS transporter